MTPFDHIIIGIAFVLIYAWCVYPPLLALLAGKRSRHRTSVEHLPSSDLPRIAVLIAAHNEEKVIGQRLANLFDQEYPHERLKVFVGVDGSSDATAAIAREFAAGNDAIEVHEYEMNRGKVAVLKDLVASCSKTDPPELLVFSDANTYFKRDALSRLIGHFSDPVVGGVCGRLVFTSEDPHVTAETPSENPSSEGFYWDWETRMKEAESRLDSCLGANGGIYAIRPEFFWGEIPDNTIIDDFVIGMKVREQGARVIFDQDAIAYEELPDISHEWGRRVRIGAGAYQSLLYCWKCMLPGKGLFSWCFWSHKVLRWLNPHMLGVVIVLAVLQLCGVGVGGSVPVMGKATVAGALATLLLAFAGVITEKSRETSGLFRLTAHFVTMQLALLFGFFRFCRGDLQGRWGRTPRENGREKAQKTQKG